MKLKDNVLRLIIFCCVVMGESCNYNTTDTQFSHSIINAKENKTYLGKYIYKKELTSKIDLGDIWVEKIWYNNNFGPKTILDNRGLYVKINNLYDLSFDDILMNVRMSELDSNVYFERKYGGYYGSSDNRLWATFVLKDSLSLPQEIRLKVEALNIPELKDSFEIIRFVFEKS